jgi:hypothetical protein
MHMWRVSRIVRDEVAEEVGQLIITLSHQYMTYHMYVFSTRQWYYFQRNKTSNSILFSENFIIVILMYPLSSLTCMLDILDNF